MRDATKLFLLAAALALLSCGENEGDQNVVITNGIPANADIEALPADESSATPTDELESGAVDENAAANSY